MEEFSDPVGVYGGLGEGFGGECRLVEFEGVTEVD